MSIQMFWKQTLRSRARLALNLTALLVVTAFFVVSCNLYQNSTCNLQAVNEAYSTIGAVAFYGNVDSQGNLVSASDPSSVGYHQVTVFDYDLSDLVSHSAVTGYELRYNCAAYIPGETGVRDRLIDTNYSQFLSPDDDSVQLSLMRDQLRFTIASSEPVTVSLIDDGTYLLAINVVESAAGLEFPQVNLGLLGGWSETDLQRFAAELKALNGSEETRSITFYPGVEYTMSCLFSSSFKLNPETGAYRYNADFTNSQLWLGGDMYGQDTGLQYTARNGESSVWTPDREREMPLYIQRSEVIAADPELAAYWTAARDAALCSAQSFSLTLTQDVSGVPAWHAGGAYLLEGRMISREEYETGARVCMVSAKAADLQGWQVGDTLEMKLYTFASYQSDYLYGPWYGKNNDGFFDKGTYTIVGIYGKQEITVPEGVEENIFFNPNTIYAPTASVQNLPEQSQWPIQPSLLTIRLKNGTMAEYAADMAALGLAEQRNGEYTLSLYTDDRGFSKVADALTELQGNALLQLGLSVVLLVVTMALLGFLFSRQHKTSAGILRTLGGTKGQTFTAVLACAALVALASGALGTLLGGLLTQSMGASSLRDVAASAAVTLHTGANPVLTVLCGLGCVALFTGLTACFIATYIGKEPHQILPENQG